MKTVAAQIPLWATRSLIAAFLCVPAGIAQGGLIITPVFTSAITSLPNAAQVENAINYSIAQYESLFSNPIHVKVEFSANSSVNVIGKALQVDAYSYDQVRTALQTVHAAGSNTLGAISPVSGTFYLPFAQEKTLNLIPDGSQFSDFGVGFSTNFTYTFDPLNRAVPGAYDFIGLMDYEISVGLGREQFLGSTNFPGPAYTPFDLFRYFSAGVRSLSDTTGAYFSLDAGTTILKTFRSGVGLGKNNPDWIAGPDAFAIPQTGVQNDITPVDIKVMNALGYTSVPEPTTLALCVIAAMGWFVFRQARVVAIDDGSLS